MDPNNVTAIGIVWYVVFLFSTVFHEAAHALVAQMGGDSTAADGGQVSLDPMPHIKREPIGMVLAPLLSFSYQGWMMGWASAPYDPYWAERYPHRAARMALAGPLANLLLAVVCGIVIKVGVAQGWLIAPPHVNFSHLVAGSDLPGSNELSMFLSIGFSLNLLLFAFNLLPLPPLDGSGAIGLLMSEQQARNWSRTVHQPNVQMVAFMAAFMLFGSIGGPLWRFGLDILYPHLYV